MSELPTSIDPVLSGFAEMPCDLDSLLDQPIAETGSLNAAESVAKKNYQKLTALQNLSSFSMQETFKRCPREYQLTKLAAYTRPPEDRTNVDHAFGHAIGAGVAIYDQTQSIDKAIFAAFMAWGIDLFADDSYRKAPKKKSFHQVVIALQKYARFYAEELDLHEYEFIALEYTFVLDLETGTDSHPSSYYAGHIDTVLRQKFYDSYLVKENKTTGDALIDPAKWMNSEQTTSYSAVIDQLGGQAYDVLYTVYSSSSEQWVKLVFAKHKLAKAEFLQDQLFIANDIERYAEANFFPKRGAHCIRFGRQCEFYGLCDISTKKTFGMDFLELPAVTHMDELDSIEHYDSKMKISNVIEVLKAKEF